MRISKGRIELKVGRIPRPFPEEVHAVTIWPVIVYEAQVWDNPCVQIHERYHWMDQLRWFLVPWFLAYLILRPSTEEAKNIPRKRKPTAARTCASKVRILKRYA